MNKVHFYYFTLKDLDPIQIIYRIKYIIKRRLYEKIGKFVFSFYEKQYHSRPVTVVSNDKFIFNDRKNYFDDLERVLLNKITFLNKEIDFGTLIQWDKLELNKGTRLWKLNLHYHDFLVDIAHVYKKTKDVKYKKYVETTINDWISNNPIGTKDYGKDNWNSYCISLRIVSWIKIYTLLEKDLSNSFKKKFIKLLWIQVEFLYDNLELDILGNHLIKNYKALQWAGYFFNTDKYTIRANDIFEKYINKQFTSHGMHEELAPMYAGIILEDLIEVYLLNNSSILKTFIKKQFECLEHLIGADNKYTFFNDSVNKNGIEFIQIKNLYEKCFPKYKKQPKNFFNFDGYIGFENENEKLIIDVGSIVVGNQSGHGHCDALSFEYFRNTEKIFTNSGVFEYNSGERRDYSRSAKAHNTLVFAGLEQSEIWSSFRVAEKAKVGFTLKNITFDSISLSGWVKGFDFNNKITHHRSVIKNDNRLEFIDFIESNIDKKSKIYFHLMPIFDFIVEQNQLYIVKDTKNYAKIITSATFSIQKSPLFREFGKEESKSTLVLLDILVGQKVNTIIEFL
jgi:hypothetical protein